MKSICGVTWFQRKAFLRKQQALLKPHHGAFEATAFMPRR